MIYQLYFYNYSVVLVQLMGIGNVACVGLIFSVTAFNWAPVTHTRQYLLIE